jgi:hypothetical protein
MQRQNRSTGGELVHDAIVRQTGEPLHKFTVEVFGARQDVGGTASVASGVQILLIDHRGEYHIAQKVVLVSDGRPRDTVVKGDRQTLRR